MKTTRRAFAMRKLPNTNGDSWPAYQVEIFEIDSKNKITHTWMHGKPDTRVMANAVMIDLSDPDTLEALEFPNASSISA